MNHEQLLSDTDFAPAVVSPSQDYNLTEQVLINPERSFQHEIQYASPKGRLIKMRVIYNNEFLGLVLPDPKNKKRVVAYKVTSPETLASFLSQYEAGLTTKKGLLSLGRHVPSHEKFGDNSDREIKAGTLSFGRQVFYQDNSYNQIQDALNYVGWDENVKGSTGNDSSQNSLL